MSALKRVPSFIHQQTRLSVNKQAVVSSNSSAINSGKHKINHTPVFVFFSLWPAFLKCDKIILPAL